MSTTASDDEFTQDDSDFRQHILQKLADFGDSLLDEDDFAERKRKATKRKSASQKLSNKCNSSITSDGNGTVSDSKHHKLKKKRKKLSVTAEANIQFNGKRNSLHGEQKHLQQLRTELGLTSSGTERLEKGTQHEQPRTHSTPRYAKLDKKQIDESNIIVFQEPGRSKKTVPLEIQKKIMSEATKKVEEQSEENHGQPEMSLKHARFDVRKFGIKRMAEADREGATVAMLMKLGAKAPKKQYINYKLLLESKKQKMAEEERLKSETDHTSGHKASAASSKKKRSSAKKDRNDIGYIDGQVGRYKGGVQLVSQSDLKSSAGKKRKKSRK